VTTVPERRSGVERVGRRVADPCDDAPVRIGSHVRTDTGWEVVDESPTADRTITVGSNFLVGNGYLGYRGTRPDQLAGDFVGCVVADTYDMADGVWRELCTVPNALFATVWLDGEELHFDPAHSAEIELSMQIGEVTSRWTARTASGRSAYMSMRRFAGLHDLHLIGQQLTVVPADDAVVDVEAGIDAKIWSLHGEHFASIAIDGRSGERTARCVTQEDHIDVVVASRVSTDGAIAHTDVHDRTRSTYRAAAGSAVTATAWMAVTTSNDDDASGTPVDRATETAARAEANGYRSELEASANRWADYWETADVVIQGDAAAQAALRFSIYHNRIATPVHSDRLPIGARGLSCQAYQGAAFWDQEMFNLPAFLHTAPEIARSILVYRWRTLDGARRKEERLGYRGAYFAWISGTTGDELCPDFFFTDVLSGRPIRNHFNVWQMHVSPDIAVSVWRYWLATGDLEFLVDHGAEVVFEVARFLHSFVRYDEVRGRYDVIRLLGPDEWHENVDNDAYTNRLVQLALRAATDVDDLLAERAPIRRTELWDELGVTDHDRTAWQRVHDRVVIQEPDPETGLIEQFDGFFELEDTSPDELRSRLQHPDEYWGWPNGVAVHTQVSKQPAVVQLFAVDGSAPLEIQRANYDYYEPRCAHGSSLSHSVHATVAARLSRYDGRYLDEAYDSFMRTATLDLVAAEHANVGGTFIGGIHTAANAGAWQTAVFGFGGFDVVDDGVVLDPRLPAPWDSLAFTIIHHGSRLDVRATSATTSLSAHEANDGPIRVHIGGRTTEIAAGRSVKIDT